MDTVILAAGRNARLNGFVAAGHKPLLVVNGQPLIGHAARQGQQALSNHSEHIIVVASPENASVLHQVLPSEVEMIIQRRPAGPGDALLTGFALCVSSQVLVLMGDNVTSDADVARVRDEPSRNVIGVGEMPLELCERFTRWRGEDVTDPSRGTWIEKVPVDPRKDLWKQDGHGPPYALAWLGPLKLYVPEIRHALIEYRAHRRSIDVELPIGPLFNHLTDVTRVEVTSVDLGTPEVLP